MLRIKPVTNEIYHIYNRGVEKRNIFLNDKDYLRFIHNLFEFNDVAPALDFRKNRDLMLRSPTSVRSYGSRTSVKLQRKLIVDILCFCLMPNHFHLLLRQRVENGITMFMRKLGTGYANYFNLKYERSGALFQGKYKFVHINRNAHFIHLPHYIHLNSIELIFPNWKEEKLVELSQVKKFLEEYRWSSHLDYSGIKNFPSVTQRNFLLDFFGGSEKYKQNIIQWLADRSLNEINSILLE